MCPRGLLPAPGEPFDEVVWRKRIGHWFPELVDPGARGLSFGPGYQLKEGITTAHDDIVATATFNDDGKLTGLHASIGSDSYSFDFDTAGSYSHFFGRLADSSSGTRPARSWCWVEYAGGMLTPELLDLMMQRFRLARRR